MKTISNVRVVIILLSLLMLTGQAVAATLSDNFNRADSNTLDYPWNETDTGGTSVILNNSRLELGITGAGMGAVITNWTTTSLYNISTIYYDTNTSSVGKNFRILFEMQNNSTTSGLGYYVEVYEQKLTSTLALKYNNGTSIDSSPSGGANAYLNDSSVLTMRINHTFGSVEVWFDSNYIGKLCKESTCTTATPFEYNTGLVGVQRTAADKIQLDNFTIDDLTTSSSNSIPSISSPIPDVNPTSGQSVVTFSAVSNQSSNNEWLIDSIHDSWSNGTNPNYTNSTATLGTHNLTLIVYNSTDSTLNSSYQWDWTVVSGNIYFIANTGDNTSIGKNWTTPWRNLTYAVKQVVTGDRIFAIDDGEWGNESVDFKILTNIASGNVTNPIIIDRFNGTPTFNYTRNGSQVPFFTATINSPFLPYPYWEIHNLSIKGYNYGVYYRNGSQWLIDGINYTTQYNDYTWKNNPQGILIGSGSSFVTVKNCNLSGNATNMINIVGTILSGGATNNITILNNSIHDNWQHNAIDFNGMINDTVIDGNTIYNIFEGGTGVGGIMMHGAAGETVNNVTIRNNVLYLTDTFNIKTTELIGGTIYNNIIRNSTAATGIEGQSGGTYHTNDINFYDNNVSNNGTNCIYMYGNNNTFTRINTSECSEDYDFHTGTSVIIDPITLDNNFKVDSHSPATTEIRFTDNVMFLSTNNSQRYYPTFSNESLVTDVITTITEYPTIKLIPSANYLTANNNTTLLNLTYNGTIPTTNITLGTGESKQINLGGLTGTNYTLEWQNGTDIETQTSLGGIINFTTTLDEGSYSVLEDSIPESDYIPPNVTSMTYTNGSTWVNHTWQPGTGNITDSYNISHNSIWTNGTSLNYSNNTVGADAWSNITVYAYNSSGSGTLNATGISQNVQTPASSFTPSNNTINCPVGWCYLAMNRTNYTLSQLDALYSDDVVQGWFNASTQKFESHSRFATNQNVNVTQKSGYYYYFTYPTTVYVNITENPTITLKLGWNLVGNMDTNRTISELETSIGGTVVTSSHWNNTHQHYINDATEIVRAGESFFVNVNADTIWSS